MKDVNVSTANEFHDWQRVNLPHKFVIQDIDTWPLMVSDPTENYDPICLIELKRSSFEPENWTPFKDDLPNYMAIHKLAQRAGIPLVIIYFVKGKSLSEADAKIAIFKVTNVDNTQLPWITYTKNVVRAEDFKNAFPQILL
ncbi:MAG: hypothetical protein NPMRTH1_1550019 [Nitrosopumilales archaeon]|nr:MAG: hypothetical protein NPMRTH1_1550019 [Nitrosopumilales archaeon]